MKLHTSFHSQKNADQFIRKAIRGTGFVKIACLMMFVCLFRLLSRTSHCSFRKDQRIRIKNKKMHRNIQNCIMINQIIIIIPEILQKCNFVVDLKVLTFDKIFIKKNKITLQIFAHFTIVCIFFKSHVTKWRNHLS